MEETENKYEIMREISKAQAEKIAMKAAIDKAKNDFAEELLNERPEIYDIPYAFTRKKPFKIRFREKKENLLNKFKATLGIYDKQEF